MVACKLDKELPVLLHKVQAFPVGMMDTAKLLEVEQHLLLEQMVEEALEVAPSCLLETVKCTFNQIEKLAKV